MIRFRDWAKDLKLCFWLLIALALSVVHCNVADACNRCGLFGNKCRFQQQQVIHHKQAIVQQVVAVPIYRNQYYFVGSPIRAEAIIQKAMQDDPAYQSFLQYKQNLAAIQSGHKHRAEDPPATNQVVSVLDRKCASCHSGDKPGAGILLDGTGPLSPDMMTRIKTSVDSGKMPKSRPPLTAEEKSVLAQEMGIYYEEWFLRED